MRKVLILGLACSLMCAVSAQVVAAGYEVERVATTEQYPADVHGFALLTSESPQALLQERMQSAEPVVVAYELFTNIKPQASQGVATASPANITQALYR